MSRSDRSERGPDKARVEELGTPDEKSEPDVFVGREEPIAAVERNCRRAMTATLKDPAVRKDATGKTFLIQGAPGAGKTSLLSHLKRRWAGKKESPLFLDMGVERLSSLHGVVREIADFIDPSGAMKFHRTRTTEGNPILRTLFGWLGLPPVSRKTIPPVEATLPNLAKSKPARKWDRPLCIMVDEIQTIGERHTDTVRALHEGRHGLPIVLVCAGLADSRSVLAKHGASRMQIANVRTLGSLSPDECAAYVKRMLDRCRIVCSSGEVDAIADGIAERSEGWPQHLHTETAALFRGLARADCNLAKVDFDAVGKRAAAYREDSYRARQSPEMRSARALVAAVMASVPENGMHEDEVQDAIERTFHTDAGTSWRLPNGMNARMFMEHLIHQGALQLGGDDKLFCPIPSLRTWLVDRAPDAHERSAAETADRKVLAGRASSREGKKDDIPRTTDRIRRQDPENEDEGR